MRLIEENISEQDLVIFTDGSVNRVEKSSRIYTVRVNCLVVTEKSDTEIRDHYMEYEVDIKATTKSLKWLHQEQQRLIVILKNFMNTPQKLPK